jgi:chaperonin GroES
MDKVKLDLVKLIQSPNICTMLDTDERTRIGNECVDGYLRDKASRTDWETQMAEANKLALQVFQRKSEPWDGASNIMFPLVTTAALQWQARAYSLLVPGTDIAKCRVTGSDPDGKKSARAIRVGAHLSYQLLEEDDGWEEDQDKTLLVQAIAGCAFKKTYFDPVIRRVISRLVLPSNIVINYWTQAEINHSPRASHFMLLSDNEVHSRIATQRFYENSDDPKYVKPAMEPDTVSQVALMADQRQGVSAPSSDTTTPTEYIEQICWYDLDGDGYAEPYVATVELSTHLLRRLVARFNRNNVVKTASNAVAYVHPQKIYTKYSLIPAPDGGYYDLGFGMLMGPINDSVNTLINQTIDSATLGAYGGGFLGRGAKFRGGVYTFKPGEWKQTDAMGDDIRKAIMPNPVPQATDVLLKMMQYLISYAERIASAQDIQSGETPGQNTPAETTRTANENGGRVFASTFKRTWRAFRNELRIFFYLDSLHITEDVEFENLTTGEGALLHPKDYLGSPTDVRPSADPIVVSREMRRQQAQTVATYAMQVPGFNKYKAIRAHLEALDVPNIDALFPRPQHPPQQPGQPAPQGEPDIVPPPNPKMLDIQLKEKKMQLEDADRKIGRKMQMQELQGAAALIQGKILELHAKAAKEISEAKATGKQVDINAFEAQIHLHEAHMSGYIESMKILQKEFDNDGKQQQPGATGGDAGAGGDGDGSGGGGMAQAPANGAPAQTH